MYIRGMSVQRAELMLSNLRETVRQDMSIAHARLEPKISAIQTELNECPVQGQRPAQDQRSTYEQLLAVYQLANDNGHYDAADWILNNGIKPVQESEAKAEHVCTFPCEICASKDPNYLRKHKGSEQ
jgi:hypothetical protein